MSRKYKFRDPDTLYFVSVATVEWIDLFIRPEYAQIVMDSIRYCQENKGLELYAWCLMTSHVHLIMGTHDRPLEDILRDLKSFTSRRLKEELYRHPGESRRSWISGMLECAGRENGNNRCWQLWQQHNQPIELSDNRMLDQRLDYLHRNPVEAGFVREPEDWQYSSALDYAGGKGLLDVMIIE